MYPEPHWLQPACEDISKKRCSVQSWDAMISYDNMHVCTPVLKHGLLACIDHPGPQACGWIHQKRGYATTTGFPFQKRFVLDSSSCNNQATLPSLLDTMWLTKSSSNSTSPGFWPHRLELQQARIEKGFRTNVPRHVIATLHLWQMHMMADPVAPIFAPFLMLTSRQWSLGSSNAAFEFPTLSKNQCCVCILKKQFCHD